jgi:hypothetical protein
MTKIVAPALFIGLGGTGHKVLLQVKKAVLKNYGEMPPMTKLLCFDTDRKELLSSSEEIEYNKKDDKGKFSLVKEKIGFNPNETIGISISNPKGLSNQNYIKSWLSDSVLSQIGPADNGAKQIRQMGRFAIFENFSKQAISGQIESKINELKNVEILKNTEYSLGDNEAKPSIHLVFSPCGGTGAGTFIDIVTIIKNIDPQIEVYGYLVMPDFYSKFPMTTSVVQNAYASLIEIDHLMGQDAIKSEDVKKNKPWSNYPKNPFKVDYSGNGTLFTLPGGSKGFFEYLYLFDNINEKGKFIQNVDDVYDRIGRILYLVVSGPGTKIQSAYSNNKDFNFASSQITNFRRRNYSSIGISQIILDRNFLKNLKTNQISKTILHSYLFSNEILEKSSIVTFIDSNSWREDNGHDMLIDKFMPRNQLKYSIDTLFPSKFKKGEWNTELKNNVDTFLRTWDEKVKTNCSKIKDDTIIDFTSKLQTEVSNYLKIKGGITKCKHFLVSLLGSFKGMADEMQIEVNTHKSNLDKYTKDIPTYIDSIVQEENAFSPINKEKLVKEASSLLIQHSEKILIENWQKNRKGAAKLFYDICIELISKNKKKIDDVELLFSEAVSDLERENQAILNRSTTESDFERYIHYYYKEILNENSSDINIEEAFKGIDFSVALEIKSVAEIKEILKNYSSTTDTLKSIDALSVEDILNKLDKETLKNIVTYLDASSSVCIDVDQSFLLTTDKPSMEKFGFICVEDKEKTIFEKGGEVYNSLSTEGGYSSDKLSQYTTGDPDKITMIKIAGMFPASSIKRINNYKDKFTNSSMYHFSDTYFEKHAQDLIDGPRDDEGEGAKWFTVGSALGKIYLDKGALILKKDSASKEILLYEGTRNKTNRFEAQKVFIKNKENSGFIENYFNTIWTNDRPKTIEMLVNFYKNIETPEVLGKMFDGIDKETEEYDNVFNEKKILKEFCISLQISPEKFA